MWRWLRLGVRPMGIGEQVIEQQLLVAVGYHIPVCVVLRLIRQGLQHGCGLGRFQLAGLAHQGFTHHRRQGLEGGGILGDDVGGLHKLLTGGGELFGVKRHGWLLWLLGGNGR